MFKGTCFDPSPIYMLVGLKRDIYEEDNKACVSEAKAETYMKTLDCKSHIRVSAKTNLNLKEVFIEVARTFLLNPHSKCCCVIF